MTRADVLAKLAPCAVQGWGREDEFLAPPIPVAVHERVADIVEILAGMTDRKISVIPFGCGSVAIFAEAPPVNGNVERHCSFMVDSNLDVRLETTIKRNVKIEGEQPTSELLPFITPILLESTGVHQ